MMVADLSGGNVIALGSMLVTALGVGLGLPMWRLTRAQLRTEEQAKRNQQLAQAIREVLAGSDSHAGSGPGHPSALDLLGEMRDSLHELATVQTILAFHLADRHGGDLPPRLRDALE